ncbi:hypothetical protein AFCDBAGC_2074 [Methylobacterium cerastii]|uniref:Sugar 3,4-ketoisomerase QdtA cupin domain-containing protein n=2 Tax=Methylobacterium cerastii TaxID=932741 RepID=A0ABQ4QG42_9HYPH|nr:hypothetical protein AFCDBAGC_2074 [Methylobacterium cerastii]
MRGAALLGPNVNVDPRGRLVAFEAFDNLPFVPQRVFVMEVDDATVTRGGHANSCDEVIVALRGAATIALDNGEETATVRLNGDHAPLWISAGILIRLENFEAGTLLLVCASERYGDTRHYAQPQKALITGEAAIGGRDR